MLIPEAVVEPVDILERNFMSLSSSFNAATFLSERALELYKSAYYNNERIENNKNKEEVHCSQAHLTLSPLLTSTPR